jgi:hypothetical protein
MFGALRILTECERRLSAQVGIRPDHRRIVSRKRDSWEGYREISSRCFRSKADTQFAIRRHTARDEYAECTVMFDGGEGLSSKVSDNRALERRNQAECLRVTKCDRIIKGSRWIGE